MAKKFNIEASRPIKGLVTSREAMFLAEKQEYGTTTLLECADLKNFQFTSNGVLESRWGTEQVGALSYEPKSLGIVSTSVGYEIIASTSNNDLRKSDDTTIEEANEGAVLLPIGLAYGDYVGEEALLVLDGRRPHLYRPNKTTSSRSYRICYDSAGYLYDKISGSDSYTSQPLYSGAVTACGIEETTEAWCNHATTSVDGIPLTTIKAVLKVTGSVTGNIYAKLYDSSGTLLATSDAVSGSTLTSTWATYTFEFSTIYNMLPSTTYRWVIEFTTGSSSNYVEVATTSGDGLVTYDSSTSSWSTRSTTSTAVIQIQPGLAPEVDYGIIWGSRVFAFKDEFGAVLKYSMPLNPDNWSEEAVSGGTIPQAGSLYTGDNAGKIKALVPVQGSLYIVRGDSTATLYRLSGATPDDWTLELTMRGINGWTFWGACNAGKEGFVLDETRGLISVDMIRTTGSIEDSTLSRAVEDKLTLFSDPKILWESPRLFVIDSSTSDVLVFDTEQRAWTKFDFAFGQINCLANSPDGLLLGAADKSIYRQKPTLYTDDGTGFELVYQTSFTEVGISTYRKLLTRLSLELDTLLGAEGYCYLYIDGSGDYEWYRKFTVPMNGLASVDDFSGISVDSTSYLTVGDLSFGLGGVYMYDHNLGASGSFAGIDLSQFGYSSDGAIERGDSYRLSLDFAGLQAKLVITNFSKPVRLKKLLFRGTYIGRRMN